MVSPDLPKTAVDSSVLVAALTAWHKHHESSRKSLEEALQRGELLVTTRVLTETYSVLTRMPAPFRVSADVAHELISATLKSHVEVVELPVDRRWEFLGAVANEGIVGGAVYDAEIAWASARAGARRILTLNQRHFERVAPAELTVVVPVDS